MVTDTAMVVTAMVVTAMVTATGMVMVAMVTGMVTTPIGMMVTGTMVTGTDTAVGGAVDGMGMVSVPVGDGRQLVTFGFAADLERASFGLAFLAKAKGRRLRSTPFPVVSDNETVPPTMD